MERISRFLSTLFLSLLYVLPGFAQTITRADLQFRGGYHYNSIDGATQNDETGFKGDYLFVNFQGDLTDKLHFDFRQRLSRGVTENGFFDGTDKALIIYTPTESLRFMGGKRCIAIGGCDFAILPINLYFTGQYCDLLALYQWGVSGSYKLKSSNDTFTFEVTQSPFRKDASNKNVYAYSLLYEASHGCVDFIHSVNFFQTNPGQYINWIMLGHRFNLGKFKIEADVLNKYSMSGKGASNTNGFFFKDFSLVGKMIYTPTDRISLAVKYCFDTNKCTYDSESQQLNENCDYHVLPGTSVNRFGAMVEYNPLKDENKHYLRLHAAGYYDWRINTNPDGTVLDKQVFVNVGATLNVDFLNLKKQ